MILKAVKVRLKPKARAVLEARVRAPTMEQRAVLRAQIVLLAAEGRSTRSIAREVGTMPRTVSQWRGRFAREGLAGLDDKPRPGPVPKYKAEAGRAQKPTPAGRVPGFHERYRGRLSGHRHPRRSRQPQHPQAQERPLAQASPQRAVPLHA